MKIPVGHKVKDFEVTEPRVEKLIEEAEKERLTGYLRVSYERSGVNDFYFFFIDGRMSASYGEEMLQEREVFGKEALDLSLEAFSKGIANLFELEQKEIESLSDLEPQILLSQPDVQFNDLLEAQLRRLNSKGQFLASLVADEQGLTVAAVDSEYNTETIAALSALVSDVSRRAENQLGFKKMDEVSLVDDDKIRLVSRYFNVGDQIYILSCVVPAYQTYRRLTNTAIRKLEKIMKKRFQ